ncbi:AraC family transcriptional regulator [Streptomyces sp. NPDC059929]
MSELHARVSGEFAPHRLQVRNRRRSGDGHFQRIHRSGVAVYELGYGTDVAVNPGELPDFYNIHIPLAGTGTVALDGKEAGSPLSIAGPGHRLSMTWSHDSNTRILQIPQAAMNRAMATRLGDPPSETIRFTPVLDHTTPPVQAWLTLVDTYAQAAAVGLLAQSPLAQGHFEQALLHGLLDTQPHSATPHLSRTATVTSAAMRRALTFCAEHAHEPISVADIAQAARISIRTLRDGFRTQLGTTPLGHLRRVRLELAHHDLLAIARGETSGNVTEVALRWGFTHLSRFAQEHRKTYGVTPSQLLRTPFSTDPVAIQNRSCPIGACG